MQSPMVHAFAIALLVVPTTALAQTGVVTCPLGTYVCPVVKGGFALCKKNDLLDFYVPGLPTTGDRESATVQVHADQFSSPDSNVFHLSGNTSLQQLDQLLRADSITYDRSTTAYSAQGDVRYQDRGMLLSADNMHGTTKPQYGVANNVKYQLLTSRGNGAASRATVLDRNRDKLRQVSYSTCELDHQLWAVEAKSMTLNQKTGIGKAHDVTVRLKGVPFLWLPYLRFPIDHRRQTGLLYPTIGSRSRAGYFVAIPFYWNIAPNYDATFTPIFYSRRGPVLDTQFRWLTPSSKGSVDLAYNPYDRVAERSRGHLVLQNQTRLPGNVRWDTDINRISDKAWFQDYGNDFATSIGRLLSSSSYLTAWGNWWDAGVGADVYQIADPGLSDSLEPYRRLPRLYFNADAPIGGPGGPEWGLHAEAVRFVKPGALDGERFDFHPYISWPIERPGWFLRPKLGVRYTAYGLTRPVLPGGPIHPSRTTPIFDLDAGLIFDRQVHLFGHDYTQTLEPRIYYLWVPYRNQDDLPLFDTGRLTFDYWQLFATNRFSGADRQQNANNLTLALTTRFIDSDGVERLSASIGQIHYFEQPRVTLYPGTTPANYDHAGSDYVGNLTVALNDNWRLTATHLWNAHTLDTDVSMVGLQRRLGERGIFNFDYRYRRGLLEQADISAEIPVSPAWTLVAGYNYSLREQRPIDAFAGVEWNSCCMAIRVLARHYVYNAEGDYNDAMMVQIDFKGLGSYGEGTGTFLRNAILGYQ